MTPASVSKWKAKKCYLLLLLTYFFLHHLANSCLEAFIPIPWAKPNQELISPRESGHYTFFFLEITKGSDFISPRPRKNHVVMVSINTGHVKDIEIKNKVTVWIPRSMYHSKRKKTPPKVYQAPDRKSLNSRHQLSKFLYGFRSLQGFTNFTLDHTTSTILLIAQFFILALIVILLRPKLSVLLTHSLVNPNPRLAQGREDILRQRKSRFIQSPYKTFCFGCTLVKVILQV